jgi:hypothetical protein
VRAALAMAGTHSVTAISHRSVLIATMELLPDFTAFTRVSLLLALATLKTEFLAKEP